MSERRHQCEVNDKNIRRLIWAFAVIVVFMLVEAIGGLISGSLALIADATHMLADGVALALAASAQYFANRPPDSKLHFGYRRAQVLAAFANGVMMAVLLCWIVLEALTRLWNPIAIDVSLMLTVAILGFVANAVAFFILHRPRERDVNMRGAMLHVVGDLLGSVAAIVAALVIYYFGWMQIDPLLSIFVAVLIGVSAFRLISETGYILLEGAPKSINRKELAERIESALPIIKDVHDIKISQITPDRLRLTLHVCIDDPAGASAALSAVKDYLERNYGIHHSTVQIETGAQCPDKFEDNSIAAMRLRDEMKTAQSCGESEPSPSANLSRPATIN